MTTRFLHLGLLVLSGLSIKISYSQNSYTQGGLSGLIETYQDSKIIKDKDERERWKKLGFYIGKPQHWAEEKLRAVYWVRNGFSPEDAVKWHTGSSSAKDLRHVSYKDGFDSDESSQWVTAGFSKPEDAKEWKRNGFSPENANPWHSSKIDPSWAKDCVNAGNITPSEAVPWHRAGIPAQKIFDWKSANFLPDEAGIWSGFQFSSEAANVWREMGFAADSADAWWEAGFQESPDAASEWRKVGITARESYEAQYLGLSPKSMIGWPTGMPIMFAAVAKDNGMSPKAIIESIKKIKSVIDHKSLVDGYEIGKYNPYEIDGKSFALDVELWSYPVFVDGLALGNQAVLRYRFSYLTGET